jgi:hypothetical protein
MMRPLQRTCEVLALLVLASSGCGAPEEDNRTREPISGTVSLDGQPLAKGTIQFQPASQAEGVAAGGMIDDGRFNIPRDEGPVPGKYKVAIDVREDSGTTLAPGETPGAPKFPKKKPVALIPPRYNAQTELTAEVKSGGPNTFTFELKK